MAVIVAHMSISIGSMAECAGRCALRAHWKLIWLRRSILLITQIYRQHPKRESCMRFALIGAGNIAKIYVEAVADIPGAEIAVIRNRTEATGRPLAEKAGAD
jgi:hypothetical protein